jgi:hypothetical protein
MKNFNLYFTIFQKIYKHLTILLNIPWVRNSEMDKTSKKAPWWQLKF